MNEEINKALQILKQGGLILYPTDTVWCIGCDASNKEAVKNVFKLKQRKNSTPLICLVADDRMLKKYIKSMPEAVMSIIDVTNKPTTIVYDNGKNLDDNIIAKDGSVAIRIPDDDFCFALSRKLNGAIVATSANISGQSKPKSFKEIAPAILKGVDYVVNLHQEKRHDKTSSIIKLTNSGIVKIIRP